MPMLRQQKGNINSVGLRKCIFPTCHNPSEEKPVSGLSSIQGSMDSFD
jgi:hypothetical protein